MTSPCRWSKTIWPSTTMKQHASNIATKLAAFFCHTRVCFAGPKIKQGRNCYLPFKNLNACARVRCVNEGQLVHFLDIGFRDVENTRTAKEEGLKRQVFRRHTLAKTGHYVCC